MQRLWAEGSFLLDVCRETFSWPAADLWHVQPAQSSLPGHRSRAGIPSRQSLAERMVAVDPNSASVLGLMGLLSKSQEGFVVLDGPTNQLHQVMEADCLCGACLSSLMLSASTSVSFPSQPSPDRPHV